MGWIRTEDVRCVERKDILWLEKKNFYDQKMIKCITVDRLDSIMLA